MVETLITIFGLTKYLSLILWLISVMRFTVAAFRKDMRTMDKTVVKVQLYALMYLLTGVVQICLM